MPLSHQRPWKRAGDYARAGNLTAAKAIYESLIMREPGQAAAWMALSDIALQNQSFRTAVHAACGAANALTRGHQWELLAAVALRLLSLGEYQNAAAAIRNAPWDHDAVLQHSAGLVQYLGLTGEHHTALQLADFAKLRKPRDASLAYACAMTLRHLGRSDEATEEYERCIALAPMHIQAHWSLASHARSKKPGQRIPRLKQLQNSLPATSPDMPYLHYALFREHEDAGEITAAWESLSRGASCKRHQLQYDMNEACMRERTLRTLCDRDFMITAPATSSERIPIFILGLPRSGTTLLERILSGHSQVQSAGELGDFHLQLCWETDQIAPEILDRRLLAAARDIDFERVGRGYMQRTSWRAEGARYVIDKFPANFVYAGFIHKALPHARIICMRRNPLDSCLSNLKELFSGSSYPHSYDMEEMGAHYIGFQHLLEHWQNVLPNVFLTVDYEMLVTEPDKTVRSVMAHCGLDFESECLDILSNTSPVATASSSQVREAIHTRYVGSWRRYGMALEPLRARLQAEFPDLLEEI